jgi:hypothetical protein
MRVPPRSACGRGCRYGSARFFRLQRKTREPDFAARRPGDIEESPSVELCEVRTAAVRIYAVALVAPSVRRCWKHSRQ